MNDLRTAFDRLLADEPPLTVLLDPVASRGATLRRRRRAYTACGVAASVAVAAAGIAFASRGPATDRLRPAPAAAAPAAQLPLPTGLTPMQRRIATAVTTSSPAGWTFDFAADRWQAPTDLHTTVDDGAGAAAFSIGVMVGTGWTQLLHPCHDAEFAAGASCTERALAGGSVLSIRGLTRFSPENGYEGVTVVLTHPNGSGINAESGNYVVDDAKPGVRYNAPQKAALLHRSRPHPVYTADQLADVVLAVDSATAG